MPSEDRSPYQHITSILKNWETSANELAGAPIDDEFNEHEKYDIDWSNLVVDDVRGKSGKFCIYHDSDDIWRFKSSKYDRNLSVPTEELIQRYRWISSCFTNNRSDTDPKPLYRWGTVERINQAYGEELHLLKDDHYLACYWLLHFGLLIDPRYQNIKQELNECQELLVRGAIDFIDSVGIEDNFPIEPDSGNMFLKTKAVDMSKAFRERRHQAMFSLYRDPKSWPQILLSFQYSDVTPHTKVYWIVKSVAAENAWVDLRSLLQGIPAEKLGYAYLVANDPNEDSKERAKHTNTYLQQLKDNYKDWHAATNSLIAVHNIHTQATDHSLLAEVMALYFTQREISNHQVVADAYTDIVSLLNEHEINDLKNIDSKRELELAQEIIELEERQPNEWLPYLTGLAQNPAKQAELFDYFYNRLGDQFSYEHILTGDFFLATLYSNQEQTIEWLVPHFQQYDSISLHKLSIPLDQVITHTDHSEVISELIIAGAWSNYFVPMLAAVAHQENYFLQIINLLKHPSLKEEAYENAREVLWSSLFGKGAYDIRSYPTAQRLLNKKQCEVVLGLFANEQSKGLSELNIFEDFKNPNGKQWLEEKINDPVWRSKHSGASLESALIHMSSPLSGTAESPLVKALHQKDPISWSRLFDAIAEHSNKASLHQQVMASLAKNRSIFAAVNYIDALSEEFANNNLYSVDVLNEVASWQLDVGKLDKLSQSFLKYIYLEGINSAINSGQILGLTAKFEYYQTLQYAARSNFCFEVGGRSIIKEFRDKDFEASFNKKRLKALNKALKNKPLNKKELQYLLSKDIAGVVYYDQSMGHIYALDKNLQLQFLNIDALKSERNESARERPALIDITTEKGCTQLPKSADVFDCFLAKRKNWCYEVNQFDNWVVLMVNAEKAYYKGKVGLPYHTWGIKLPDVDAASNFMRVARQSIPNKFTETRSPWYESVKSRGRIRRRFRSLNHALPNFTLSPYGKNDDLFAGFHSEPDKEQIAFYVRELLGLLAQGYTLTEYEYQNDVLSINTISITQFLTTSRYISQIQEQTPDLNQRIAQHFISTIEQLDNRVKEAKVLTDIDDAHWQVVRTNEAEAKVELLEQYLDAKIDPDLKVIWSSIQSIDVALGEQSVRFYSPDDSISKADEYRHFVENAYDNWRDRIPSWCASGEDLNAKLTQSIPIGETNYSYITYFPAPLRLSNGHRITVGLISKSDDGYSFSNLDSVISGANQNGLIGAVLTQELLKEIATMFANQFENHSILEKSLDA